MINSIFKKGYQFHLSQEEAEILRQDSDGQHL